MKVHYSLGSSMTLACALLLAPKVRAQQVIPLFSPVNVRASEAGTGEGTKRAVFNSTTLNLSCPAWPKAVLSSMSPSRKILVDNMIEVTNLTSHGAPVNVCTGGVPVSCTDSAPSCYNGAYLELLHHGHILGKDPDSFVSQAGLPAIDISWELTAGVQQLKIELADEGRFVSSSSILLNTNCVSLGVTGPASITGNPISSSNPTTDQLNQDFSFNSVKNQMIGFEYNLGEAQAAGTLKVEPGGVIPRVADLGLDPVLAYPALVKGTSFATSACLVHDGEVVDGKPACKLYTLQCTTGTGSNASGAQCPVSSLSNELLNDVFDGPGFSLSDIKGPGMDGPVFHEGIGFLMASEQWGGGTCTFDPASGLAALLCPQNLLTSFTGPGLFTSSGRTTHPNSTFISVAKVPEDLTTVTIADEDGRPAWSGPGHWTNRSRPHIRLSSKPPDLTGTGLPGADSFVAAPIESITYGVSRGSVPPVPGSAVNSDIVLMDPNPCPSPADPRQPAAHVFSPPIQQLDELTDGSYLLHYYAQDCAGTEELRFEKDSAGSWSTNFYVFPINVDTVPPRVTSKPVLTPAGPYKPGQTVTAAFSCADDRSGIIRCGDKTYRVGTLSTGQLTTIFKAEGHGEHTFTVKALDAAGNEAQESTSYQVVSSTQVELLLGERTLTCLQKLHFHVHVGTGTVPAPTGIITLLDGGKPIGSYKLLEREAGSLSGVVAHRLAEGRHTIEAIYSGDVTYPAGRSASISVDVKPKPVHRHGRPDGDDDAESTVP